MIEKRYSVKQVVFDLDKKTKRYRSHYITIGSGLTWMAAKAFARGKYRAQIVQERANDIGDC
jgi:hypothetical protein